MAWTPISLIVPQYENGSGVPYSGAVLKAYSAGTSTNISMATDSTGATTFTSIALNASGYPAHNGSIVIPHVSEAYKLALYANQAAADANSGAIWAPDNNAQIIVNGTFIVDDATSSGVTNVITATHTTTGTPVAGIGTGIALATETATGNTETGMLIQSVTTDVTNASEDFDAVIKLMAGGSAAAEKIRVKSTGDVVTTGQVFYTGTTLAAHATTMNPWTGGNYLTLTGSAVTFTALTAAPQAGMEVELYMNAAHVWTDGAVFEVDGDANYTSAIGDRILLRARTTTVFTVHPRKASGLPLAGLQKISRTARTSNTILGAADTTKFFDVTSGTFTQTLDPAATLGEGWYVWYRNSGTGIVTINPDGAETINGSATLALSPGMYIVLQCTGSAFFTAMVSDVPGTHVVTVTTGNGWGAVNTKVRRFTTALENTGTAITYADSANNGGSFTINDAGFYSISYQDGNSGAAVYHGASVNSAELTTDIQSITAANRLFAGNVVNASNAAAVGAGVYQFAAGDVVRVHGTGASQLDAVAATRFSIRKVRSL